MTMEHVYDHRQEMNAGPVGPTGTCPRDSLRGPGRMTRRGWRRGQGDQWNPPIVNRPYSEPTMSEATNETMRDLYREHGYDPDTLVHPRDATAEDFEGGATLVAYLCIRNPDIDGPATTWDIIEWDLDADDVHPTDADYWEEYKVSWPDDSPVTHGVHYGAESHAVVSIGYGDEMYGPDGDFEDPQRWERTKKHVLGLSDPFIRFRFGDGDTDDEAEK